MSFEPGKYVPKEFNPSPITEEDEKYGSPPPPDDAFEDPVQGRDVRKSSSHLPVDDAEGKNHNDVPPPPETTWRQLLWQNRGIFCAIMSSFTFAVTAILVKLLKGYDSMDVALWRCQGVIFPAVPLVARRVCQEYNRRKALPEKVRDEEKVWWNRRTMLFLWGRCLFSINALFLHFLSLRYIPAGDSVVISSCTPTFAYILAYFLLGEPYGWVPFITSMLTLFGVVTIVRPPFLTGQESFDRDTLIGTGLALGCTVLTSISFVTLRNIRAVPFTVTALAYGLWGAFENSIIVLISGTFSFPRTNEDWVVAGILGVLAFFGQIVIVLALKIEQTGPVSLIRSFDVLFAFFFQSLMLRHFPDIFSLIGAAIVLINVFITGLRKWVMSLPEHDSRRISLWFLLK